MNNTIGNEYIYESPDGGETIYRRKFGQHDNKEIVKAKEISINVNSQNRVWNKKEISYEELILLALNFPLYTITYRTKDGHIGGTLISGESVQVTNDMMFNVIDTSNA